MFKLYLDFPRPNYVLRWDLQQLCVSSIKFWLELGGGGQLLQRDHPSTSRWPPIFEVLVSCFVILWCYIIISFVLICIRLFELVYIVLQTFPAILSRARQRRVGLSSFHPVIPLILLLYYIVMQNLACIYTSFMKHNPIFSQKCSKFSSSYKYLPAFQIMGSK